ncbi:MAG: ferritin family protein [Nitrospinota bacterium]
MQATVQLFKTALKHEVKSEAFYNRAAEITKNDESRMLFLELSDMENDHIRHIINKTKGTPWPQEFNPETYVKELESSIKSIISVEETEILENGDMKTILELAIGMEKEAYKTYLELEEKAASQEVKNYSRELSREEQKHLNSLTSLLTSLDMDEEDRSSL